jgi:molybdopterin synthase sulfur carrier subunit
MRITVKLFATLREGRFDKKSIECDEGATIEKILKGLDIPKKKASIIFVNNRHADLDRKLSDEDVVALFPPIGGG